MKVKAALHGFSGGHHMCGRFLLDSEIREIISNYNVENDEIENYRGGDFYPSSCVPILINSGSVTLKSARWGFNNRVNRKLVINARVESILDKPMFKASFSSRRCIIPANGFYEWQEESQGKRTRHKITLRDKKFISLGGIYNIFMDENYKETLSIVIITTEARNEMKKIHSRMPLIIGDNNIEQWLRDTYPLRVYDEIVRSNPHFDFIIERSDDKNSNKNQNTGYEQIGMF